MNALKLLKNWKFLLVLGVVVALVGVGVGLWKSWTTGALVAAAVVAAFFIWVLAQVLIGFLKARWASKKLENELSNQPTYLPAGLQETSPGELKNKFKTAIQTLKTSLGKGFLYELPWYVLMGEAGSGKTTSLRKSNIRWPLGGEQQGIGGTVNCDWWFANDAVILDTAGRFAVHDAGSPVVPVWENFLKLLKRVRPRKPIDGVVVAIPADSLISSEENREKVVENAKKVGTILHDKLSDLQRKLGVVFPVYILVTKCDKIRGFEELFTLLPPDRQGTLFGWSNPHSIDDAYDPNWLKEAFGRVGDDLDILRSEILRDGETPENADLIYLFPEEFQRFQSVLEIYLEKIFEFSRYEEPHRFRGFFFSSGGQDQNPLSSLVELEKREAAKAPTPAPAMGTMMIEMQDDLFGRPYFVHDFYTAKVFKESGLSRPSTKVEGTMGTIRLASQIGAGALAVLGIGFFIWQLFSQSGSYNTLYEQLLAVEKATYPTQAPDAPPYLDYKFTPRGGGEGDLVVDTFKLLENPDIKISTGDEEQISQRLDQIFWWELRRYITKGNAAYARNALRPAGKPVAFAQLGQTIDKIYSDRRRMQSFLSSKAKFHDIARTAVELYEPIVGPEESAGIKLFFQEPYIEHESSVEANTTELGVKIKDYFKKTFSQEDLTLVTIIKEAYETSSLSSSILHEEVEGKGYLFKLYGKLFDQAAKFKQARIALDGSAGSNVDDKTVAQQVLDIALLSKNLDATLQEVNATFQKALEKQKTTSAPKEGGAPGNTKIEAVKSLVASMLPKDIQATSKGIVGFLVYEAFDPELGQLQSLFKDLIAKTDILETWNIGDAQLENWKLSQNDLKSLFQTLLIDARNELNDLNIVVDQNQLALEIDNSTKKMLSVISDFSKEVTGEEDNLLIKTIENARKELNDLNDNPEAVKKLVMNSGACTDLNEKTLKIEYAEFQKLQANNVGLDNLTPADKTLNSNLFNGGLQLLFVHFWSKALPLVQKENANPNNLSTGLRELLIQRLSWEPYLSKLMDRGMPQVGILLKKMEEGATLDARKSLTDLMEQHKPQLSFLPSAEMGYSSTQRSTFLNENSNFAFFKTLYQGTSGELDRQVVQNLREYLQNGKKAFDFIGKLVSASNDSAVLEYGRVKAAFDPTGQKVSASQQSDYMQIKDFLGLLEETRLLPDTFGAVLAVRIDTLRGQIEKLGNKSENFFTRQRIQLLKRLEGELTAFLAHKLISESNVFIDQFDRLATDKFPFGGDPTQKGVPVDELLALADQKRARFLGGLDEVTVEDQSYNLEGLVTRARPSLPKSQEGVPDFSQRVKTFASILCGEIKDFLKGDLGFSVFYRPEESTEVGGERLETLIDSFELTFPGDISFSLCNWGPRARNNLWQVSRARNLITGNQGQQIVFNLGMNSEEIRSFKFDKEKLVAEKSKGLFFEIKASDGRCGNQDIRNPSFKGTKLVANSIDGWYVMRFLKYLGGKPWDKKVQQLQASSLKYKLVGHVIRFPLVVVGDAGRKAFELPVIVTFWSGENQDQPVLSPNFDQAFENFTKAKSARWNIESLQR